MNIGYNIVKNLLLPATDLLIQTFLKNYNQIKDMLSWSKS
jgi:hypothetical protein